MKARGFVHSASQASAIFFSPPLHRELSPVSKIELVDIFFVKDEWRTEQNVISANLERAE